MHRLTLETENGEVRVGPLVTSELNNNPNPTSAAALAADPTTTPGNLEFIELYNPTAVPMDLTRWKIRGAISYDFAAATMLGVDEILVVTSFNPGDAGNSARLAAFHLYFGIDTGCALVGGY